MVRHRLAGATAVVLAAVLLGGCQSTDGPLAARDSFFASPSATAAHIGLVAGAAIEAHRDLAAIQRACSAAPAVADPQATAGIECRGRTTGFYGSLAEAFRRWAEDQVRELPSPEQTAASAGG
jgi:hypothetical protein